MHQGMISVLKPTNGVLKQRLLAERGHLRKTARCRETALGDQVHHLAEPVNRHGDADQRHDHQPSIQQCVAASSRRGRDDDPADYPEHGGAEHQRQRHGPASATLRHDAHAAVDEGGSDPASQNSRFIMITYCTGSGRSKPNSVRIAAMVSCEALRPAMRAADRSRAWREDQEHQRRDAEHHEIICASR